MNENPFNILSMHFFRQLASLASGFSNNRRLLVLIFHRVMPEADPMREYEIDAEIFDWKMGILSSHFNVLSLQEALQRQKEGKLPDRAVCISFDDGYADNYSIAFPILKKWNLPATFFIATGFLNGGRMWNDSVIEAIRIISATKLDLEDQGLGQYNIGTQEQKYQAAMSLLKRLKHLSFEQRNMHVDEIINRVGGELPVNLMMNDKDVVEMLDAGMEIGAHTVSHPILTRISEQDALIEMRDSKHYLENLTGKRIRYFAYPNGRPNVDYQYSHVNLVRQTGFEAAMSTAVGSYLAGNDIYQIPRYDPWASTPFRFGLQMASAYRRAQKDFCTVV
jgi:peptidoglycan/xylan/chitin deacetylase (PgdA/CDA1 family)